MLSGEPYFYGPGRSMHKNHLFIRFRGWEGPTPKTNRGQSMK